MADLKTYLASKYMSGPKADAILARSGDPTMKKKRKKPKNEDYPAGLPREGGSGLSFKDEDEWKHARGEDEEPEGEDAPLMGKELATYRKSTSAWSTVGSTSVALPPSSHQQPEAGPSSPHLEIKPDPDASPAPTERPQTKRKGGLRSAAQLREEEEERRLTARSPSPPPDGGMDPTATVHRDASGRIVDVDKLKEERIRQEKDEERKKREKEEWGKGLVQRRQRDERAREEKDMREKDVGRYANDATMNKEMKEEERWNDPAAEFLTKKKTKKGPRRPQYQGACPPNRFNIRPGFRWDGVDRSMGFEKKFFQYQNAAARKVYEHNQWSVEDM